MAKKKKNRIILFIIAATLVLSWVINTVIDQQMKGFAVQAISTNSGYTPKFKSMGQVFGIFYYLDELELIDKNTDKTTLYCDRATVSLNPATSLISLFNRGVDNNVIIDLEGIRIDAQLTPSASTTPTTAKIPLGKELASILSKNTIFNKIEFKLNKADIHISDTSKDNPVDERFSIKHADLVLDREKYLHGTISIVKESGTLEVRLSSTPKSYDLNIHTSNLEVGSLLNYIRYNIIHAHDITFDKLNGDIDGTFSLYEDLGYDMNIKGKGRTKIRLLTFKDTFNGAADIKLSATGLELTNIQGNYKKAKIIGKGKVMDWMSPSLDFELMTDNFAVDDLLDLVPEHKLPIKITGDLDTRFTISGKAWEPVIKGSASSSNLSVLNIRTHTGADFEATINDVKIKNIVATQNNQNRITGNIYATTQGDYSGGIHISGNANELLAENLGIKIENMASHLEMDIGLDSSKTESISGRGRLSGILWNGVGYETSDIILNGDKDKIKLQDISIKNEKTNLLANLTVSSTSIKLNLEGSGMSLAPFERSLGEEDWAKQIDMRYATASGKITLIRSIQEDNDKHKNSIEDLSGHVVLEDIKILRERFGRIETDISYKNDVIKLENITIKSNSISGQGNANINIRDMTHPYVYAMVNGEGNIVDSMFLQLRFGQMIGEINANIIAEGYIDDMVYHIIGSGKNIYSNFGFLDRADVDMLVSKNFAKITSLNGIVADGLVNLNGVILFDPEGNDFDINGRYRGIHVKKLFTDKRLERMLTQKKSKSTQAVNTGIIPIIYAIEPIRINFASTARFEDKNSFIEELNKDIETPETLAWLDLIDGRGEGKFSVYSDDNGQLGIDTNGSIDKVVVGSYNGDKFIYDISFFPKLSKFKVKQAAFTHNGEKEADGRGELDNETKRINFIIDFSGMDLDDIYKMAESKLRDIIDFSQVQSGSLQGRLLISGTSKKPDITFASMSVSNLRLSGTDYPQAMIDASINASGIKANRVYISNNEEKNSFNGFVPYPFDIYKTDASLQMRTQLANSLLMIIKSPVKSSFGAILINLKDKKGDISGEIKLDNGRLAFESVKLDNINADIMIKENIITNIKARQLYKKQSKYITITGSSPKSAISDNDLALSVLSDPIHIEQPTMKGEVKAAGKLVLLPKLLFKGDIGVMNSEFSTDKAKLPAKPLPLEVEANVSVDETNSFIDDFINVRPTGSIYLNTEKRLENGKTHIYPVLSGTLNVPQGRIVLFTNQFSVTKGQAVFASINKTEPTLDITAQSVIRQPNPDNPQNTDEYTIILHITGIAPYYQLSYDGSTGPNKVLLSKYEVEKILGGDITSLNKGGTSQVATKYAASALRLQLFRGFEQSVEDSFGLESFQFNLNPTDSASNNWDVNLYISKELLPNVFVIYSPTYGNNQKKSDTGELRYRLSNNMTIFGKSKNEVSTTGSRKDDSYGLEYNILF